MPPLMEPEPVMNLLDSFWCEQNVVSKNSCSSPSSAENQIQTSHTRSMSDQSSIVKNKKKKKKRGLRRSVLQLELKELKGFMDLGFTFSEKDKNSRLASVLPGLKRLGKKREEKEEEVVISRPYLSEAWEFLKDEKPCWFTRPPKNEKTGIKKFLNLVFLIFSKEEKKSSLASIKKEEEEEEEQVEEEEELDYDKALDKLMNWKLPPVNNEVDMKSNLMSWVQTATFIVR